MKLAGRTITGWRVFGCVHMAVVLSVVGPLAASAWVFRVLGVAFHKLADVTMATLDVIADLTRCRQVTERVRRSVLEARPVRYQFRLDASEPWEDCTEKAHFYYSTDGVLETRILRKGGDAE